MSPPAEQDDIKLKRFILVAFKTIKTESKLKLEAYHFPMGSSSVVLQLIQLHDARMSCLVGDTNI